MGVEIDFVRNPPSFTKKLTETQEKHLTEKQENFVTNRSLQNIRKAREIFVTNVQKQMF
jgi:hypothetical protein